MHNPRKSQRPWLLFLLPLVLALGLVVAFGRSPTGQAAPGEPDLTLAGTGRLLTDFGGEDEAQALAQQPDDKILVAGFTGALSRHDFVVARYTLSGTLDPTFGAAGHTITDVGADDAALAMTRQDDGKIVLAGYSGGDVALARYNLNGTLDTSFGPGGKVVTPLSSGIDVAYAVAVQVDGKIVVAGTAIGIVGNVPDNVFALVRYNPDGTIDTGFGTRGRVLLAINGNRAEARSLVLQPDGKIVAGGYVAGGFDDDFALLRLQPDGIPDPAFGTSGQVVTDFSGRHDRANAIALQADGRIVAGGYADSPPAGGLRAKAPAAPAGTVTLIPQGAIAALACYTTDGSLDTTFGVNNDGRVTIPFPHDSMINALALQPNGKIMIAGTNQDIVVARYFGSGYPDPSYSKDAQVVTRFDCCATDSANAILVQNDGKSLVAGFTDARTSIDFALARYQLTADIPALPARVAGPIATGPGDQQAARVEGDLVVWEDNRNGSWDIYAKDLLTGITFPVVAGPGDQRRPDVSRNMVVWQDNTNGDWDIYGAILSHDQAGAPFAVFVGPSAQVNPVISGRYVAWQSAADPSRWDIVADEVGAGQAITLSVDTENSLYPAADGSTIIWQGLVPTMTVPGLGATPGRWHINGQNVVSGAGYGYDDPLADRTGPALSGNRVIWQEYGYAARQAPLPKGRWSINGSSLGDNQVYSVTNTTDETMYPDVSGDDVVYQELPMGPGLVPLPKGRWSINKTTVGGSGLRPAGNTTQQISHTATDATHPAIDGEMIVWQQGSPHGDQDVYGTVCLAALSDVRETDYFYAPVQGLACGGVISGYADGTFRPYNNTTRGQLSKMVVLSQSWLTDTTGGPHFNDVPPGSTFYDVIETAYHRGIISGYADGTFRSNNNVTRGQLSKIIVGAAGWISDTTGGPHFSDVPPGSTFYPFVETAYHQGIISGYADGTFRVGANATRGQIAKIIFGVLTGP